VFHINTIYFILAFDIKRGDLTGDWRLNFLRSIDRSAYQIASFTFMLHLFK